VQPAPAQYRAHRQAADEQLVDLATQARRRIFHALVPLFPGGRQQVIHGAAMAGQLHAVYGEAGVVQALAQHAHFRRGAGQAVDQQHALRATGEEEVVRFGHLAAPGRQWGWSGSQARFSPAFQRPGTGQGAFSSGSVMATFSPHRRG
jgi:hypothetical protein